MARQPIPLNKKVKADCDTCRLYIKSLKKGHPLSCFLADYYMPSMIFYCRLQMRWACAHLPFLEESIWPPQPSGYTDPAIIGKQVKIPSKAAIELAIEVNVRLETCGKDGKDLVSQLVNNGIDIILTERAFNALNYISGWRRRKTSYGVWMAKKRYKNIPFLSGT